MDKKSCYTRKFLAQFPRGPGPVNPNLVCYNLPAILRGNLLYQVWLFQHTIHYPQFIETDYRWMNQAVMALTIHAFYLQPKLQYHSEKKALHNRPQA